MNIEEIAKVAHEINKAFCEAFGDESQVSWDDAPDWQRSSALNGVAYHIEHPDAKPSHSHDCWMEEKLFHGWKYGPVKDEELKEHPCIVAFDDLPKEQQAKDFLFRQVVHSLKDFPEWYGTTVVAEEIDRDYSACDAETKGV